MKLPKKGITFKASVTQIYQGNFTDGSNDMINTGATAALPIMRWTWTLASWGCGRAGSSKSGVCRTIARHDRPRPALYMPVDDFSALFPWPGDNYTGLTDFIFMQFLSEHFGLFAGKMNTL